MYSLSDYGELIADRVRMEAFAEALRRTVKPGSVVLEIGTGPGIFAIFACQLGAGRVVAIEPQGIIQSARENADINQCSDRIEFIEGLSTNVSPSVQADVVISDIRGVLPPFGSHIPSIVDARRRFLRAGGVLIPREETIWGAVVETPKHYSEIVDPWERNVLDIGMGATRRLAVNALLKVRVTPDQLLASPQLWMTMNYLTIEDQPFRGEMRWTIERDALGHGIVAWFDSDLADGVSFSNAPGAPHAIYASLFFPWTHPIQLAKGETVCIQLEAIPATDDYVWRWTTRVEPVDTSGKVRHLFDQSTLATSMVSLDTLRKLASGHTPRLSGEGVLDRTILSMMDGRSTLEEISRKLAVEFPDRFSGWHDAMKFVGAVSRKYSL
jgi:protein arginine N-methyltransferase 1